MLTHTVECLKESATLLIYKLYQKKGCWGEKNPVKMTLFVFMFVWKNPDSSEMSAAAQGLFKGEILMEE